MGSSKRKDKNGPKLNDWDHAQTVRKLDDQLNFGLKAPQNLIKKKKKHRKIFTTCFSKKKKKKITTFFYYYLIRQVIISCILFSYKFTIFFFTTHSLLFR